MKSLFKAAIVALVVIPCLVRASSYKTESINAGYAAASTYYKGYAYIFYVFEPWENHIDYAWFHLGDDGSIKAIGAAAYGNNELTNDQLTCCVFLDKIYFFWRSYFDNKIYYDSYDGTHWSGKTKLGVSTKSYPFGMAVAVLGDRLYLFYQDSDNIKWTTTTDGKTWTTPVYVDEYGRRFYTGGNIAAAAYFQKYGDGSQQQRILIAWPNSNYSKIEVIDCYLWRNDLHFVYDSLNQYATGVAMVDGSVNGAGTAKNTVQIFAVGKKDPWTGKIPYLRAEYQNDEHGGNFSGWETVGSITLSNISTSWLVPSVATNYKVFGTNALNLRQEIWMLYPWMCIRWDSDQYVMVNDTSLALTDDSYKANWTLLGVIEGPPPYALNGRDPTDDQTVQSYSELDYTVETDTAWNNTCTTSAEFFVSLGGPGEEWPGAGVSYTYGLEHAFGQTTTHHTRLTESVLPTGDTSKFWCYRFYLRPTLRGLKYEIRDWKGNGLGRYAHIFSISDVDFHCDPINLRDSLPYHPHIWDPTTYMNRHLSADTTHYRIKAKRSMGWAVGTKVELEITTDKQVSSSQSHTNTIKIEAGMEHVFDISVQGSVSIEQSVTTDSIYGVTVMNQSPNPRPGQTGDIKSFTFIPYWFEAKDSIPWWIPTTFKGQKPWCITYEVTEVKYNTGAAEVAEKQIPLTLNLDPVSPNPTASEVAIRYTLPKNTILVLNIYDATGRLVTELANEPQNSGVHCITWNGSDQQGRRVANGVYFCRLRADGREVIRRIVMIK